MPPLMLDRVQPLAVDEPVDLDLLRLVLGQPLQHRARHRGSRCGPSRPGPSGRRPRSARPSTRMVPWQPPSIRALDGSHEHGETAGRARSGCSRAIRSSPLRLLLDLLVVVEDPGDVTVAASVSGGRGSSCTATPPFMSHAPRPQISASAPVLGDPGRDVAGDRHGVQVTGDDHPLGAAELGPGHDHVAVPGHLQMRVRPQCRLDPVGDRASSPLTDSMSIRARSRAARSPLEIQLRSATPAPYRPVAETAESAADTGR